MTRDAAPDLVHAIERGANDTLRRVRDGADRLLASEEEVTNRGI